MYHIFVEKDIKIVLATSKPEIFAERILEYTDLLKYFTYVSGASLDEKLVEKQDIMLKKIAVDNNIKYQMVNAYLLSKNQQEKLNSLLKISSVEDQIIILIKEQKIVGSIRGVNRKSEYISKRASVLGLYSVDFQAYKTHLRFDFRNSIAHFYDK